MGLKNRKTQAQFLLVLIPLIFSIIVLLLLIVNEGYSRNTRKEQNKQKKQRLEDFSPQFGRLYLVIQEKEYTNKISGILYQNKDKNWSLLADAVRYKLSKVVCFDTFRKTLEEGLITLVMSALRNGKVTLLRENKKTFSFDYSENFALVLHSPKKKVKIWNRYPISPYEHQWFISVENRGTMNEESQKYRIDNENFQNMVKNLRNQALRNNCTIGPLMERNGGS